MNTDDNVARGAEPDSPHEPNERERKVLEQIGMITLLAVAAQALMFPGLGYWAGALIGIFGSMPAVHAFGRRKPYLVGAWMLLMAISGSFAQFLYTHMFSYAMAVATAILFAV